MTRAAIFVLLLSATSAFSADSSEKPNIVFILADDLGWRDLKCYGSSFYQTPNVDKLAQRGMRFVNAYAANPLCSPTRASLLTGQYPGRLRFTTPAGHLRRVVLNPSLRKTAPPTVKALIPESRTRLPLEYFTLAEALKEDGYRTAHFGKWHLGWEPYSPEKQGFEVNMPGGSYPGPPRGYFAPHKAEGFKDGPKGEHIEDRMTAEAIRFMKANRDRRFFLNYWMFSVHAPFQAKENLIQKYRKGSDPKKLQKSPVMGGMIHTMDACVGRLVQAIEDLKLSRKTLLLFFSDNGGNMYNKVEGGTPTNNAPLRGGKATIYEGGVRVPFIAVWPGKIKAGSMNESIVSSIDFYPTLLELVGRKPKKNQILDGQSILSTLISGKKLERDTYFCHFPHYTPATGNLPSTSVRRGDWKLIRFFADGPKQEDRFELYNLAADIGESKNLADSKPDLVKELNALITQHLKETKALIPIKNPAYDPKAVPSRVGGWVGSRSARLSIEKGALVLRSIGRDPFAVIRKLSVGKGPFTLEIQMRSTSGGRGQIFWQSQKQKRFHRDRSVTFAITHDGQSRTYRVELPTKEAMTSLRIDPGQKRGIIHIENLRLKRGEALVQEWTFDTKKK